MSDDGVIVGSDPAAGATPGLVEFDPDDPVRREVEAALEQDGTALGDVWRRLRAGQSEEEIRVARRAESANFVWNYRRVAQSFFGDLPTAPTVALAAARSLRGFLKRNSFSPETRARLEQHLAGLNSAALSRESQAVEEHDAREATLKAEDLAAAGVYVYSLPHYLRYPYDEASGHTLLKVGRTIRSVAQRLREQSRTTALPEDPVLLRVYQCEPGAVVAMESSFHRLLAAADHDRSTARTGGTEWFLTSVKFLDAVAAALNLSIHVVSELADYTIASGI